MVQDKIFWKKNAINCKGNLLFLDEPIIMGILNATPDSFFDGGSYQNATEICFKAEKMLTEGATILDIGGYSTRPNAEQISVSEELNRVIPAITAILKQFPNAIISIDTFRYEIAIAAIEAGAAIINDISGGSLDEKMFETVAQLQVPYILMHIQGNPQTMQNNPQYTNVVDDIIYYFSEKIAQLTALGVNDIILDPGFGFGKTNAHNFEILNRLDEFQVLKLPILVGFSRKSMIYKSLESSPKEALNGTTVLNGIALTKGAKILRVHDVKAAKEVILLHQKLKEISKI